VALAPYHGLTMWILWLWGMVSRERNAAPPAPAPAPLPPAEATAQTARRGVAELASLSLEELMIPRSQVVMLQGDRLARDAIAEVARGPHALYPVYGESVDQPLGVVRILDLADPAALSRPVKDLVRAAPVVPETMNGLTLLRDLRGAPVPAALVVDEFGGMAGFVTVEDLIEVLVGDLVGEHDVVRARIVPAGPGSYRVDGTCTVEEFNHFFGAILPEGEYETVAGFLLDRLGRIPQSGDAYDLPVASIQVLERTERRILSVIVRIAAPSAAATGAAHPVQSGPARRE
jgi:putative hemolysin